MTFSNNDLSRKQSGIKILLQESLYPDLLPWHHVTIHMTLAFNTSLFSAQKWYHSQTLFMDRDSPNSCMFVHSGYIGVSSIPYITYISPRHGGDFIYALTIYHRNFTDYAVHNLKMVCIKSINCLHHLASQTKSLHLRFVLYLHIAWTMYSARIYPQQMIGFALLLSS